MPKHSDSKQESVFRILCVGCGSSTSLTWAHTCGCSPVAGQLGGGQSMPARPLALRSPSP